jgi:hypothetical protein
MNAKIAAMLAALVLAVAGCGGGGGGGVHLHRHHHKAESVGFESRMASLLR